MKLNIDLNGFFFSLQSRNKEEKHDGTRIIPKAGTAYSNFSQKYMVNKNAKYLAICL